MGSGSGVIFKGKGFYKTDYVKNEGKKPESSGTGEKKKEGGEAAPSPDTKTPPATPPDSATKKE